MDVAQSNLSLVPKARGPERRGSKRIEVSGGRSESGDVGTGPPVLSLTRRSPHGHLGPGQVNLGFGPLLDDTQLFH